LKSFADDLRGGRFFSDSRIHIPEMYTEPSRFASVVAVGPMRWIPGTFWHFATGKRWLEGYYEPFSVNVGETVLCNRYPKSARPILWRGQDFVIVDENEILAKVEHGA
jgi:co-chaperonin GroES (HSP10)